MSSPFCVAANDPYSYSAPLFVPHEIYINNDPIQEGFAEKVNNPAMTDLALIDYLNTHPTLDVNEKISGNTPAFLAAQSNRLELLRHLVAQNADINLTCDVENQKATLPLHAALDAGHLSICHYLIEQRADIDTPNKDGDTPMHLVIDSLNVKMKAPDKMDADSDNSDNDSNDTRVDDTPSYYTVFAAILLLVPNLNVVNDKQQTPLFKYIETMAFSVNDLIKANADINFENAHGINALTIAARTLKPHHIENLTYWGAKASFHPKSPNLLGLALQNPHCSTYMLETLIKAGAHVNAPGVFLGIVEWKDHYLLGLISEKINSRTLLREGNRALLFAMTHSPVYVVSDILELFKKLTPRLALSEQVLIKLEEVDSQIYQEVTNYLKFHMDAAPERFHDTNWREKQARSLRRWQKS